MVAFQNDSGEWHAVSKQSARKTNLGGKKHAARSHENHIAIAEVISTADIDLADGQRQLLVNLVIEGQIQPGLVGKAGVEAARAHHAKVKAELPASAHRLTRGEPAIPTRFV
jgi:nicotinate phosphoribosyltransferase